MNDMSFSTTAEDMHADAAEHDERAEVFAMLAEDAGELPEISVTLEPLLRIENTNFGFPRGLLDGVKFSHLR